MKYNRRLLYCREWFKKLMSTEALTAFLSSFGFLWVAVQITTFVVNDPKYPNLIRGLWPLFGLAGVAYAAYKCRPHLSVSHKLNGRDVTIELVIGDVFALPGALVVGTNTTFDTHISRELISERSVQGTFTKRYYGDAEQLDREISSCLTNVPAEKLPQNRLGKAQRYPMGTCVRLNPKDRTVYFVAIADINEHGVAHVTFDDLKECLAKLWVFIDQRGLKEHLVMPVLGTGFGRLNQTREKIIHEIVASFVAACAERAFADHVTIVLTPSDVTDWHISLDELGSYLCHVCRYASVSSADQRAIGTPVQ
jgi:hypothetical protein